MGIFFDERFMGELEMVISPRRRRAAKPVNSMARKRKLSWEGELKAESRVERLSGVRGCF